MASACLRAQGDSEASTSGGIIGRMWILPRHWTTPRVFSQDLPCGMQPSPRLFMSSFVPHKNRYLRAVAAILGSALLVYLVVRAGSDRLIENAQAIGWGILLVIGLAGVGHLVKTWAWRLTLPGEFSKVPFSRTLGLRLVSEALGQFG